MTSNEFGVAPSILNRSYKITAEIAVPQGGANGVLVTQGGRFSGYALYLTHPSVIKTTFLLYFATPAGMTAACDAMDAVSIIGLWKPYV